MNRDQKRDLPGPAVREPGNPALAGAGPGVRGAGGCADPACVSMGFRSPWPERNVSLIGRVQRDAPQKERHGDAMLEMLDRRTGHRTFV